MSWSLSLWVGRSGLALEELLKELSKEMILSILSFLVLSFFFLLLALHSTGSSMNCRIQKLVPEVTLFLWLPSLVFFRRVTLKIIGLSSDKFCLGDFQGGCPAHKPGSGCWALAWLQGACLLSDVIFWPCPYHHLSSCGGPGWEGCGHTMASSWECGT